MKPLSAAAWPVLRCRARGPVCACFARRRRAGPDPQSGGRVAIESGERPVVWGGPLLALLDEGTASGAEMLAATAAGPWPGPGRGHADFQAGHDPEPPRVGRGGDAQSGLVKITFAEMFRVSGRSLHGIAVTPDVVLLPEIAAVRKPSGFRRGPSRPPMSGWILPR